MVTLRRIHRSRDLFSRSVGATIVALSFVAGWVCVFAEEASDEKTSAHSSNPKAARFFTGKVLPILQRRCFECHSHQADSAEGGLVLDSAAGWRVGGDSGPAIAPGNPMTSRLIRAVEYSDAELRMPPKGKMSRAEIATLRQWVARGAFDPRMSAPKATAPIESRPQALSLWSLQPIQRSRPPKIANDQWSRNPIDKFILATLKGQGLHPSPLADRATLLRRATFDLTGLPPTVEQILAFESSHGEVAFERLIDQLLSSPQYGERWGRHWLDLARYGDSNGGDINYAYANAWRYRDYVVQAFNQDKPYDEFVREQLAGDLLAKSATQDERRRELLTATGFLALGPKMLAEVDTDKLLIDIVDEQLDVAGQTFLGLTIGCARCHDHKFDPITSEDYYGLAGIFRSTQVIDVLRPSNGVSEWLELDISPPKLRARIAQLQAEARRLKARLAELGVAKEKQRTGSNAALRAIVASGLPPLRSTTWSVWARIDAPQKLGAVVSAAYDGANQGHSLGFDQNMTPRVVWNHGKGRHTIITSGKNVTAGQWHHLGVSYDADSETLRLFVDGKLEAEAQQTQGSPFGTIGLGRRESSQQFPLVGDVDEVRIYSTALTEKQLQELYEKRDLTHRPLLYWDFEHFDGEYVVESKRVDIEHKPIHGLLVGLLADAAVIKEGLSGSAISFRDRVSRKALDPARVREVADIRAQLNRIESSAPKPDFVMAVADADPKDLHVHVRGSHLNLGHAPTPRRTPGVFSRALPTAKPAPGESGRRQLADWIVDRRNPLTARVMANRIWQGHFGRGLAPSASNFGVRGERPSHPRLLDWLAAELMEHDWSVKHLHQLIMTSATYRMRSEFGDQSTRIDPENRWLATFPVRRLEAEAIRDSLLAVSDELDRSIGGTLLTAANKKRIKLTPDDSVYTSRRRSIYLPSIRVRGYSMFSIFDVSASGRHVDRRSQTMVAQQSLFLLNNPQAMGPARRLATRVMNLPGGFSERVDFLFRSLYGRHPRPDETKLIGVALADLTAASASRAKPNASGSAAFLAWRDVIHTMICANEFIYIR